MMIAAAIAGIVLVLVVLGEAFETIVLPRRVTRQFRLTRIYYRFTWRQCIRLSRVFHKAKRRDTILSWFGPLSLICLLVVWALGMILGFALLDWASGSQLNTVDGNPHSFWTDLYMSGTTFFTLGLGDVTPHSPIARLITVIEGGTGFGFLAVVIGYLPTIYGAFSRRETNITLLDARAGSPPTAGELLRRHARDEESRRALQNLLADWERWSADLLESHLSYPVLCYYRSQHDNESWLGSLTCILDTCALVLTGVDGIPQRQAQLTFAIARHALVDLAQIFSSPPQKPPFNRLPPEELSHLRQVLATAGIPLRDGPAGDERLEELRRLYEPYAYALSNYLLLKLPAWLPAKEQRDNWQTSAWGRITKGIELEQVEEPKEEHF
jgi:hypothetical protein